MQTTHYTGTWIDGEKIIIVFPHIVQVTWKGNRIQVHTVDGKMIETANIDFLIAYQTYLKGE